MPHWSHPLHGVRSIWPTTRSVRLARLAFDAETIGDALRAAEAIEVGDLTVLADLLRVDVVAHRLGHGDDVHIAVAHVAELRVLVEVFELILEGSCQGRLLRIRQNA